METSDELLQGKTILLVDDDARNIFALSSYLEIMGLQIYTAGNGLEAIAFLRQHPGVDLVLMDMMMPGMDGFEAIEKIQQDPAIPPVPIIAVTARAMKGDREKCLAAGANEYVSKPVNLKDLLEKMASLLA